MKPRLFEKMVVDIFDPETLQPKPSIDGNIPMYVGNSGTKIEDSKIAADAVRSLAMRSIDIVAHINDTIKHLTVDEKTELIKALSDLNHHIADALQHVSASDRAKWDSKETPANAQAKADVVQENLDIHINDYDLHLTTAEKAMLNGGIYNKTEIDNKLAQLTNGLDWKDAVQKYSDLEIVYPNAEDGWTANVLDDNITYRYTVPKNIPEIADESLLTPELAKEYQLVWVESIGNYMKWNGVKWVITSKIGSWIAISANAITKATEEKDGLMSKEDYHKLLFIEENANNYIHPDELKHLSEEEKNNYLEIYDGLLRGDPHKIVTAEGILLYKYNGIFTPEERQKLGAIENEANYYVHPESHPAEMITESDDRVFLTLAQRNSLSNMATKTIASVNLDGLMSKEMYSKLYGIEYQANNYIHPNEHPATMIATDENHLFISQAEKDKWDNPPIATQEMNGLMSFEDKIKLDSINLDMIYQIPDIINAIDQIHAKTIIGKLAFSNVGTTITHNLGTMDYSISITPISTDGTNPNTNVSNIWVEYTNNNECIVHADIQDISKVTLFSYLIRAI